MAQNILNAYKYSPFMAIPDETGPSGETIKRTQPINFLQPTQTIGVVKHPLIWQKNMTTPKGQSTFAAGSLDFDIPMSAENVGEMYIAVTMDALTSGNYCDYLGFAIPMQVEVIQGGKLIWMVKDYMNWKDSWFTSLPADVQTMMNLDTGGTEFASGAIVIPIVLPWSRFVVGFNAHTISIPEHMLRAPMQVKITFRPAAQLLAADAIGTPSFTDVPKLWYIDYMSTDAAKAEDRANADNFMIKSVEIDEFKSESIASGVEKTVDISNFQGNYRELLVYCKTTANVDTAHAYSVFSQIDKRITLSVDNRDAINQYNGDADITRIIDYDMLLQSPQHVVDSNIYHIKYDHKCDIEEGVLNVLGTFNANAFKKITLTIKQDSGSAVYLYVIGIKHAIWRIRNGILIHDDSYNSH